MDFDFRSVNLSSMGLKLSPPVQTHVKKVYLNLAGMLLVSTVAAYLQVYSSSSVIEILSPLSFFGGLACLIGFYFTDEQQNHDRARALLFGFSVFKGLALGPLIQIADFVNPSIVPTALGSAAMIFACLSAAVLYSPIPQQFYVAGLLASSISVTFWLSIVNLFLGSDFLFSLELIVGLGLFSLYVIYDTQVLIAKAEMGSKAYLRHSLDLYIDAVAIFVRVLMILLRKENKKRKSEKDD